MQQPPNPFQGDANNPFSDSGIPSDPVFQRMDDEMPAPIPIERTDIQPQLKKLYLALIAVGLTIGLIVSIGVLRVIDHFGLSDVPAANPPAQVD
ncbi:MAG: hypothetical protein ACFB9N_12865 [Geitlerinemataceae cyanobacterium]